MCFFYSISVINAASFGVDAVSERKLAELRFELFAAYPPAFIRPHYLSARIIYPPTFFYPPGDIAKYFDYNFFRKFLEQNGSNIFIIIN